MVKNFNIAFLIFIVFLLINTSLYSQKIIKTESGLEVIINEDGSWRYKSSKSSQTKNAEIINEQTDDADEASGATIESKQEELDRLRFNAFEIEANAAVQLVVAKEMITEISSILKTENKSLSKLRKKELNDDLAYWKNRKQILEKDQKSSDQLVKEVIDLYNSDNLSIDYKIMQVRQKIAAYDKSMDNYYNPNLETNQVQVLKVNNDDVMQFPPQPDCEIRFEGIDELSGKVRKELAPQPFFSYTHPKLKNTFGEEDFIDCNAFLTATGGYVYLTLELQLASDKVGRTYGSIDEGNLVSLFLINGEKIVNSNMVSSPGIVNTATKSTHFRTVYALGRSQVKNLKKYEIDKIGIVWSSGYEEYEVYQLDFFMNQLKCLEK